MEPNGNGQPAVLYVDDEPRSVKYFKLAFERTFRVLTAGSAAEAERLLAANSGMIGVLMSDQRMPVKTGVQLMDRVKERYPDIVRVLTTAYADLESAVDAVNRGEIHRYILKPWDVEALRGELSAAMGLFLRRRHEKELLEARRRTIISLASHIAHELSTPLATIHTAVAGIKEYLPDLLGAYRRQVEAGFEESIPEPMLDLLDATPGLVLSLVDRTNMLIRMLLMNAVEDADDRSDFFEFSIRQCIDAALGTYPFSEGEEALVSVEGSDFMVYGSELLMSYVVYNLLKNALYAVKAAKKGDIRLRILPGEDVNRLLFSDTGTGIAAEVLPHVFDEFFSGKGKGRGTGMGLPFCRRVLTAFGGHVECRSCEGEYTELELTFPKIGNEKDTPQTTGGTEK